MNIMKSIIVAVLLVTTIVSCKKDNTSSSSFAGIYQGKWGDVNQTPTGFIKFDFKSNGTLTRLNEQGQIIANGTWQLSGINFECTYTHTSNGQVHKIAGLYTDFDGAIMGTWGYSPSKTNGGTIELEKQ